MIRFSYIDCPGRALAVSFFYWMGKGGDGCLMHGSKDLLACFLNEARAAGAPIR